MRFKCNNYFVLIFFYSGWNNLVSSRSATSKSGPFKTVAQNVNNKCENVSLPYEKVSTGFMDAKLVKLPNGAQVIRINVTIFRSNTGIMLRLKGYKWENNKWNLINSMNNIGCRSVMFLILIKLTDFDMDTKRCSVAKGSYILKDLNMDEVDHVMAQKREYGKMKWRVEIYLRTRTIDCFEYETVIIPAASSS